MSYAVYDDGLPLPSEQQQLERMAADLLPLMKGLPIVDGRLALQTTGGCKGIL